MRCAIRSHPENYSDCLSGFRLAPAYCSTLLSTRSQTNQQQQRKEYSDFGFVHNRSCFNVKSGLQRNITMLLSRITQFLSLQLLQHGLHGNVCCVVQSHRRCSHIWLHCKDWQTVSCILLLFCKELSRIFLIFSLRAYNTSTAPAPPITRDFGSRPCVVHVTAKLLTAHYDVRTTVRFTQCDSNLRHSSFTVSIQQFKHHEG